MPDNREDPEVGLKTYIEKVMDERHRLYETQFQSLDAHIARSLAAKEMQAQHSEWGAGTLVVIAMALLAILISVVLVLVRK